MINYLQSGGRMFYGEQASYAKASMREKAAEKVNTQDNKLISEKLLQKLQENGIPVDVDNFMNKLADLETDIDRGLGVNKRAIYALQAQANRIIQQADYLKNAEKSAEDNGALGEIAVGNRGELFVIDEEKKKVKSVSAASYDFDKDGAAMTVGELIQHRKFNSAEAYDIELTRAIHDNIGMSKINDYIQKIVETVGDSENTQEAYIDLAGYIGKEAAKKPTGEQLVALQSMNQMIKQLGPDAIFKIKDTAQGKNLKAAFEYIQSVLPRDMKIQLMGRNVAAGNKYETGSDYIQSLIAQSLYSGNKTKEDHYIDYSSDINTSAGTKAGTPKEQNRNLGVLEQLVQGSLGKRDYKLMNQKNPEYSLNLHGTGVGSLATFNNNIVDKTTLSMALKSGLAPLVDEQHITIGNQKVSTGMLDTILYNGGDVINIWAPVNSEGDVDLEQLQTLSEIQNICRSNPQLTKEDKQQLLEQYGLNGTFDDKGVFHGDPNTMAQFLVMTGVTSDEIIDDEINPFADKLSKQDKKSEFEQIERIYGELNKGIKGKGKYKFQTGWFDFTTDLYRAPIFMKLNQTAQIDAGTFSDKGPIVKTPTYQEQLAYDQIQNSKPARQLATPSTSALYG